jgi:hypothetical protein
MKHDLDAFSDVACQLLFDPTLKFDLSKIDVFAGGEPDAGSCLVYSNGSDGTVRFRVWIEEVPSDAFRARAAYGARTRLLRVPSGRLVATGLENAPDSTGFHTEGLPEGEALETTIPPGNYDVEAFDFDESGLPGCLGSLFRRPPPEGSVERELMLNPNLVFVVLRRLPDEASLSGRKSCVFGRGFHCLGPEAAGLLAPRA